MKCVTPEVEISPAATEDVPAITALLRDASLPYEDFADQLAHFLVANQEGKVVGAIGFERHGADALLRSLVVSPGRRGGGLGGRLVEQLTAAALAQGVKRFYLLTTTAEAFFAKRGFRPSARPAVPAAIAATKEFNSLCPVSAVCMARSLRAAPKP
jgi:amino-acid N-acetyltransferase